MEVGSRGFPRSLPLQRLGMRGLDGYFEGERKAAVMNSTNLNGFARYMYTYISVHIAGGGGSVGRRGGGGGGKELQDVL